MARDNTGLDKPYIDLRLFPLSGVQVEDRYRFRIRLRGKYPQFRYWMAMPFFAPMPWEADAFYSQEGMSDRNITLNWYPVGTGPFMLTENNPNLRMVLSKNPHFHGELYPSEGAVGDREAGLLDDISKNKISKRRKNKSNSNNHKRYPKKRLKEYWKR